MQAIYDKYKCEKIQRVTSSSLPLPVCNIIDDNANMAIHIIFSFINNNLLENIKLGLCFN